MPKHDPQTTRPAILDYLLILSARIPFYDENAKRLRIAISPEEAEKIRVYCLGNDGKYFQRVRDIPLVIEEKPMTPDLLIEYAENQGKHFGKYEVRRTL